MREWKHAGDFASGEPLPALRVHVGAAVLHATTTGDSSRNAASDHSGDGAQRVLGVGEAGVLPACGSELCERVRLWSADPRDTGQVGELYSRRRRDNSTNAGATGAGGQRSCVFDLHVSLPRQGRRVVCGDRNGEEPEDPPAFVFAGLHQRVPLRGGPFAPASASNGGGRGARSVV